MVINNVLCCICLLNPYSIVYISVLTLVFINIDPIQRPTRLDFNLISLFIDHPSLFSHQNVRFQIPAIMHIMSTRIYVVSVYIYMQSNLE